MLNNISSSLSFLSLPSAHHNTWKLEVCSTLGLCLYGHKQVWMQWRAHSKYKCTQTHTTKSRNIQLVLGPVGWLSLNFYKRLVGERRNLQPEVPLLLSSNYIYAVYFGKIKFGGCITPLGLQSNQLMSFRDCTDGSRSLRFLKSMLILFPTKLNSPARTFSWARWYLTFEFV